MRWCQSVQSCRCRCRAGACSARAVQEEPVPEPCQSRIRAVQVQVPVPIQAGNRSCTAQSRNVVIAADQKRKKDKAAALSRPPRHTTPHECQSRPRTDWIRNPSSRPDWNGAQLRPPPPSYLSQAESSAAGSLRPDSSPHQGYSHARLLAASQRAGPRSCASVLRRFARVRPLHLMPCDAFLFYSILACCIHFLTFIHCGCAVSFFVCVRILLCSPTCTYLRAVLESNLPVL